MAALLKLSGAIDWLSRQAGRVAAWCVLLAVLISAGNATIRYLLSLSSNAWLEVQWYLFSGMFLLGAANTLRTNEHVRVDLLYANVPDRARLRIDAVGLVLFLLPAMAVLAWMTWPVFTESLVSGEMSGNAGGLIRWPVKLLMPVGFALVFLQGVSELIKRVAALRREISFDAHYEKPLQ